MEFGLDKCGVNAMERGKWRRHEGYDIGADEGQIEGM